MANKPPTIKELRSFDHCVLPVPDLSVARDRLDALGFTVAPDAVHPFGTENACVYFKDGTFLEPLAIAQREDCERTAMKGNVFTARDQAWRFRNGENGFSAVVFASDNADRDHLSFRKQGHSAGKKLTFGRTARDLAGNKARASFKLAFAADLRAPDVFFFTCQVLQTPNIDRSALKSHDNGTTGIAEIIMCEPNPTDFQYLMQNVVGNRDTHAQSFGMEIEAANATINLMTPDGIKVRFGITQEVRQRGLTARGIVFTVDNLQATAALLEQRGITPRKMGNQLVIDPAMGQGCIFAFVDQTAGETS